MENILRLYALPYDPKRPVVCFDERPCFLIGDLVVPLPMQSKKPKREDYHYSKHGSCALLMAFEPHTGRRWAKVYAQRTAKEYSDFMQYVSQQFPEAEQIMTGQPEHASGGFVLRSLAARGSLCAFPAFRHALHAQGCQLAEHD